MNEELEILRLADYSEKFTEGDASAYLIINREISEHPCMFGFVNLPEDLDCTKKLFSQIEAKARAMGFGELIGPINHDTWMDYRWALNNYDWQFTPDCANPPYYVDYIRDLGYSELYTYRSALVKIDNPLFRLGKSVLIQKTVQGFRFEKYQNAECAPLMRDIFEISRDAFAGTELYSDIPYNYFEKLYASKLKDIPGLTIFVAYSPQDVPIGYVLGYPSPDGKMFISKTSAVIKKYQRTKVYTALLYLGLQHIQSLGFDETLFHFQCEQRKTFKRFDGEIEGREKRYAVFKKEL